MAILVFAFTGKRFVSGTWTRLHQVANGGENVRPVHKGDVQEEKEAAGSLH